MPDQSINQSYELLRYSAPLSEDLADVPDNVEHLTIHAKTRSQDRLDQLVGLRRLRVGGATLPLLEQVVQLSRLEELLLVCPVCDTLPDSWHLPELRILLIERAPKLTSIESLAAMKHLGAICLKNLKKLVDYSPLGELTNLRRLELGGDKPWERFSIDSLSFLSNLRKLENLTLNFAKVQDGSLRPIASLPSVQTVSLWNVFPREEFAYLTARLPHVRCHWLSGHLELSDGCPDCRKKSRVLLTGIRQGNVCRNCDKGKFERKMAEFQTLVESFRGEDAS